MALNANGIGEWREKIDCSCVCETESVLLLALLDLVLIFHNGAGSEVVFQNRHVMVTLLGCCCW